MMATGEAGLSLTKLKINHPKDIHPIHINKEPAFRIICLQKYR